MKTKDILKEEREKRINEHLQKIKNRTGHFYFISNIAYPENEKIQAKYGVFKSIVPYEKILPIIEKIIKDIKINYIKHIWDQNAITAVYLLIGKAYGNLETMISLAKEGRNFEIIELARSGHESLDLAFLFLEEGQEKRLESWFKGEIIENKKARETLHRALNSENIPNKNLPMYDLKTTVYNTYSLYTHSSYAALLDSIDVFHEDFDYERVSGFHWTLRNFDVTIGNLTIGLLLELKNIFTKYKNLEGIVKADRLLAKMGNYKASEEEIKDIIEKYNKVNKEKPAKS